MRRLSLALCLFIAGCPAPSVAPDTALPLDAPAPIDAPMGTDVPTTDAGTDAPTDAGTDAPTIDSGCIAAEICGNGIDDDCNGTIDDSPDLDGDGWSVCDGDCCDSAADCDDPTLVSPGAYDFAGDGVDDDCSGAADDALTTCDSGIASDETDAARYVAALGLCETTTESPPLADRRAGLISAAFALASGTGTPASESRSVRSEFGAIIPRGGDAIVVLSSGHAAAPGQTDPDFASFVSSVMGTTSSVRGAWLDAHDGVLPSAPGCPAPTDEVAYDSVLLRMRIRVPTNARALALDTFFLASEFPEWVCSPYTDYAVVFLDSTAATNPADHNLAQILGPGGAFPLGTGLAVGNTGYFTACQNGDTGCGDASAVPGNISSCTGTASLAGTGFDLAAPDLCDTGSLLGGGTDWLVVQGNVVPGEIIELSIAIWDTGDAQSDSVAIFDHLRWLPHSVDAGIAL